MSFLASICIILIFCNIYECSKSSKMCEEYAKAVYTEEQSPVLMRKTKSNRVSNCAIDSVPLIIGGTTASEKEFPHMAVIGFGDSPDSELTWSCGGSLISDLYILTAAHCLECRENGPAQAVRLGSNHLDFLDPDVEEHVVVARIPHPDYKPPLKANDIALIKLKESVQFSPHIRPACLNSKQVKVGTKGIASGFGKLAFEYKSGSRSLRKVTLNVYSNNECAKTLTMKEKVQDTMICAGELAGGKDTCQGDSGGPFQTVLKEPYCMYNIIGVTSFGKFCGFASSPGIYTNVASFLPWIESIVW